MRTITAILMAITLLLSSCSIDATDPAVGDADAQADDVAQDGGSTVVEDSAESSPIGASRLAELVGLLPRSALDGPRIFVSDWELAGDQFGTGPPGDCTNEDRLRRYLFELTGPEGPEAYPGQLLAGGFEFASLETEFGFSLCDITGVAEGSQPPQGVSAFTVTTPVETIEERLPLDPTWGPDLMVVNEGSADEYYQWGDDPLASDPQRRTPMRPLGRGGVLLVDDGTVVHSTSAEPIEELIAGDSVGLSNAVLDVVNALAEEGVHTAFVTEPSRVEPNLLGLSVDDVSTEFDALLDMALKPYSLLGVGVGYDPDERQSFLMVVMLNSSSGRAIENAERFRRIVEEGGPITYQAAWSDFVTIESSQTQRNVTTTRLVSVDSERPLFSFALNSVYRREGLFATS